MDSAMSLRPLVLLLLACLPMLVLAQGKLRDPTLPPAAFSAGQTEILAGEGELRLEAVRRTSGGKAEALINGEFRRVGDEAAGRKVLRIGEAEVVLKSGDQRETLRMSPGVEKTMNTNRKDRPGAEQSARGGV
jgi:hypothetical protein